MTAVRCRGYNILELIFGFYVYFLKFSTLALFRELFRDVSKTTKNVLRGMTYLTTLCCVVSITATLYTSFPADRLCDPKMDLSVTAYKNVVNGEYNYVSTLVLDLAIFIIPVRQLFPLWLESRKKTGILIAFGLGFGLVIKLYKLKQAFANVSDNRTCVIALGRICVVELEVVTKALTNKLLMGLEPSVGIIAVCIPPDPAPVPPTRPPPHC
ncbi:hypothetical protein PG996_005296 [Apiospora saccharicola]|uniref:Rhodopsin domain-containing protein n=1 Tax=Apiospora saccharicola TaxID=335842 RepID=A0ABR1VL69_9PEZI